MAIKMAGGGAGNQAWRQAAAKWANDVAVTRGVAAEGGSGRWRRRGGGGGRGSSMAADKRSAAAKR